MASFKRLLLGQPIETEKAHHERLPKVTALAVFASDAISSTAYATQEIMLALMLTVGFAAHAGTMQNLNYVMPIGIGIALLLGIVSISYRQTVYAYPSGGGAYLVAKENLGQTTGLVAAAALLIDYVLTVAVSIAVGVSAITSAFHGLEPYAVQVCFACIALVTLLNLRGAKESGTIFAIPTYLFVFSIGILLICGFYRYFGGGLPEYAPLTAQQTGNLINPEFKELTLFLLLRAFASGCTALTGIEAISDGVPAFRPPESRNAAITLVWMSTILVILFLGVTALAYLSHTQPILQTHVLANGTVEIAAHHGHIADPQETLLSVLARRTFGDGSFAWFYYVIQAGTAMISILAANTAYQDFPRLASVLARDRFMPRQLSNVGDRLVFTNGILSLAVFSALLVWAFKASVTQLLALYALGVFMSFTLSQSGMVLHWYKLRVPKWHLYASVNALGAITTFIVMCIITYTKFMGGAWMVIVAIPLIVALLRRINTHYRSVSKQLSLDGYRPSPALRHHVFVLAPDIHRGVIPALQYARSISEEAKAIHVAIDPTREQRVRTRWTQWSRGIPLVILQSPYRSLLGPIVQMIDRIQQQEPNSIVTIIVPEFVPTGWFPKLLHGQAGLLLSVRLRFRQGVVVINVPYHIEAYVELAKNEEVPETNGAAHGASHGHSSGGHTKTGAAGGHAKPV